VHHAASPEATRRIAACLPEHAAGRRPPATAPSASKPRISPTFATIAELQNGKLAKAKACGFSDIAIDHVCRFM